MTSIYRLKILALAAGEYKISEIRVLLRRYNVQISSSFKVAQDLSYLNKQDTKFW